MFRWFYLAGAALCAAMPATPLASNFSVEEFSQSYTLSAHGRISLENLNGDVRINTWDRDEVKVEAVKRAARPERLGDARIVVDGDEQSLSIRTQYAGEAEDPAFVEYRITVPRQARLSDVKVTNGGLSIFGLAGDVRASAINGNIHAEQLEGEADLSTVNGHLEAGFHRLTGARAISLSSVNGPITLSLPADAKASVNARNLAGGIQSNFGAVPVSAAAGGHRLRTTLKGGGRTHIHLHNVNGGISISRGKIG